MSFTAIMMWTSAQVHCSSKIFGKLGGQIDYYIPDRRVEGYGIHHEALEKLATEHQIMITTDCGITAVDELHFAEKLG